MGLVPLRLARKGRASRRQDPGSELLVFIGLPGGWEADPRRFVPEGNPPKLRLATRETWDR
jgi:hypothetical protein